MLVPGYPTTTPRLQAARATRSIEMSETCERTVSPPKSFNARKLGADMGRAGARVYGKVPLGRGCDAAGLRSPQSAGTSPLQLRSMKVGARTMWAKATGKNLVGMGRAPIGPLGDRVAARRRPVELNTALTDLSSEMASRPGVYVRDSPHPLSRS